MNFSYDSPYPHLLTGKPAVTNPTHFTPRPRASSQHLPTASDGAHSFLTPQPNATNANTNNTHSTTDLSFLLDGPLPPAISAAPATNGQRNSSAFDFVNGGL